MSVRNAILGFLAQHPRHGYELRAAFESLIGGEEIWDVKPAQIYSTLSRLEDGGFVQCESVEQSGGPEKRIYAITPLGRADLIEWLNSGISSQHQRDELFIKLMICLAISPEHPQASPSRVLQSQRSRLYQELHEFTVQRDQAANRQDLAQVFLLDKAIMHLEADLRWLDLVEARLDDLRRQPRPEPEIRPRGRPRKGQTGSEYPPPDRGE